MHEERWLASGRGRWRVRIAETRRERRRGLVGAAPLRPREALVLPRCRSVHTVGMRIPIDVILLDGSLTVLGVVTMRPRRVLLPRPRVRHVLEATTPSGVRPGDRFVVDQDSISAAAPSSPIRTSRDSSSGSRSRRRAAAARR